jgi:hypothetical protein
MVFIINTGEQIPQERVLRLLRLFAQQVMPALDRDARPSAAPPRSRGLAEPATPVLSGRKRSEEPVEGP